jgi:hypothetical protein
MTPKEKAIELVDKFSNEILLTINGGKVAALIAVDEVLKTNTLESRNCGFIKLCEKHEEYW